MFKIRIGFLQNLYYLIFITKNNFILYIRIIYFPFLKYILIFNLYIHKILKIWIILIKIYYIVFISFIYL